MDTYVGEGRIEEYGTKAYISVSPSILTAAHVLGLQPSYVSSSQSLLVTSTASRSQAQNVEDCLHKVSFLHPDAAHAFASGA